MSRNEVKDGAIVNGSTPLFSQESSQNNPVKPGDRSIKKTNDRIIKKAKRIGKGSPRKDSESSEEGNQALAHGKKPAPFSKNSKKSRNPRSKELPKGGAGGKGTWGKPGSGELDATACIDSHDPNYDSENEDDCVLNEVNVEQTGATFEQELLPILKEYLEHGDTEEVVTLLEQLNMGTLRYRVPGLAINLALERHDPHRELTSQLISGLHGRILSQEEYSQCFNELLDTLSDLSLDTPNAPVLIGQFIARAVADDCLPKNFVGMYKGKVRNDMVKDALEKAEVLISMNKTLLNLDSVWGIGGGNRPVKALSNNIGELLKEYLNSADIPEAQRCLIELDVPHFHHEVVYQTCYIVMEEMTERAAVMMTDLIKELTEANIITKDMFAKGVRRVYQDMTDICLDVPDAYPLLENFGNKLYAVGVLTDALLKEMPNRGRKRFASEGDGGKLKA